MKIEQGEARRGEVRRDETRRSGEVLARRNKKGDTYDSRYSDCVKGGSVYSREHTLGRIMDGVRLAVFRALCQFCVHSELCTAHCRKANEIVLIEKYRLSE